MSKKLTKSSDKMIAGVVGGFAEYMGIDKTLARVLYAAISIPGFFPCIILYIVAAWVMPEKISERIETGLLLLNKGTGCGENSPLEVCLFSKSVSQGAVLI